MDDRIIIRAGTYRAEITISGLSKHPLRLFKRIVNLMGHHMCDNKDTIQKILAVFPSLIQQAESDYAREKLTKRLEILQNKLG